MFCARVAVDKTLRTPAPGAGGSTTPDEVNHQPQSLDDQYIGIIIGVLTAVIILLFAAMVVIVMRQRRRKYHNHQVRHVVRHVGCGRRSFSRRMESKLQLRFRLGSMPTGFL